MKKSNAVRTVTLSVFLCLQLSPCFAHAAEVAESVAAAPPDSAALIAAAQAEITAELQSGNTETACDLYLEKVLARAGFKVDHFLANEFDSVMHQDLPKWSAKDITADNLDANRESLRQFLNNAPDKTVFLTQWPRIGRSGHVAMVVKESADVYTIYQAQLGLSLPAAHPVKIEGLLYPQGQYGDRSHIRLFYE